MNYNIIMNKSSLMVSDEIIDQVDETQFSEPYEEVSDVSQQLIIMMECEETIVPGIIEKYTYKCSPEEEASFVFMTKTENISQFLRNMNNFKNAKLYLGSENIEDYLLEGMVVQRISIEQKPAKAGCVITVVYK